MDLDSAQEQRRLPAMELSKISIGEEHLKQPKMFRTAIHRAVVERQKNGYRYDSLEDLTLEGRAVWNNMLDTGCLTKDGQDFDGILDAAFARRSGFQTTAGGSAIALGLKGAYSGAAVGVMVGKVDFKFNEAELAVKLLVIRDMQHDLLFGRRFLIRAGIYGRKIFMTNVYGEAHEVPLEERPRSIVVEVKHQYYDLIQRLVKPAWEANLRLPASTCMLDVDTKQPVTEGFTVVDDRPVWRAQYPVRADHRKFIDDDILDGYEKGHIEPVQSHRADWYNHALISADKRDDVTGLISTSKRRTCDDLREINKVIEHRLQQYPMNNLVDALDEVVGHDIVGCIDIKGAFPHITVDPEVRHVLAFTWPVFVPSLNRVVRRHQHTRMIFGGKFHPQIWAFHFNRLMFPLRQQFQDVKSAYADDQPIATRHRDHASPEAAARHYAEVVVHALEHLTKHGVRVGEKCRFGYRRFVLLGRVASADGIALDLRKLVNLHLWPSPHPDSKFGADITRSLFATFAYLCNHIPLFARVSEPLRRVMMSQAKFVWGPEQDRAYRALKALALSGFTLHRPDYNHEFYTASDWAPSQGKSAACFQVIDGRVRWILFKSVALVDAEHSHTPYQGEANAAAWCLEQCRPFVLGFRHCHLCDHKPLEWLFDKSECPRTLLPWVQTFLEYSATSTWSHYPGFLLEVVNDATRIFNGGGRDGKPSPARQAEILAKMPSKLSRLLRRDHMSHCGPHCPCGGYKDRKLVPVVDTCHRPQVNAIVPSAAPNNQRDQLPGSALHATPLSGKGATMADHSQVRAMPSGSWLYACPPAHRAAAFGQLATLKAVCDGVSTILVVPLARSNSWFVMLAEVLRIPWAHSNGGAVFHVQPTADLCQRVHSWLQDVSEFECDTSPAYFRTPLQVHQVSLDLVEDEPRRVVDSVAEQQRELQAAHQGGHEGATALVKHLRLVRNVHWPGMVRDAQRLVRNCIPCLRYNIGKTGFHPAPTAEFLLPWEHVLQDFAAMPTSRSGRIGFTAMTDRAGFSLIRPQSRNTRYAAARSLLHFNCILGFQKIFQSDNGAEFANDVYDIMMDMMGTKHQRITPRNSQANGFGERPINIQRPLLLKLSAGMTDLWDLYGDCVNHWVNQRVSSVDNTSLFTAFMGRRAVNLTLPDADGVPRPATAEELADRVHALNTLVWPILRQRRTNSMDILSRKLNARRNARFERFRPGQYVMLRNQRTRKDEPSWVGPWRVAVANKFTYMLTADDGKLTGPFSTHMLKPAGDHPVDSRRRGEDSIADNVGNDADNVGEDGHPISYEIELIRDHVGDLPSERRYLVRWKGYSEEFDEWLRADQFDDDSALAVYHARRDKEARQARGEDLPSDDAADIDQIGADEEGRLDDAFANKTQERRIQREFQEPEPILRDALELADQVPLVLEPSSSGANTNLAQGRTPRLIRPPQRLIEQS